MAIDKPIAGLLKDLKRRGLLDETLVVFATEFGRTPGTQGSDGRDHHIYGFSVWLAGGGVKGGVSYGATDDFGYKAVAGVREIHDLHATMLHILGVDHTRLTELSGWEPQVGLREGLAETFAFYREHGEHYWT